MISLCTVIYGPNNRYIEHFTNSLSKKCKLISETVIANLDKEEGYHKEYKIGEIQVKEIALKDTYFDKRNVLMWKPIEVEVWKIGHSFGMLLAIQNATNKLIYMCDPDIVFFAPVDQIYLDLMEKHNLKFIGAAHHISLSYNCKYFPNIVNLMTKKEYLPKPGIFKGIIKAKNVLQNDLEDKYDYLFEENYLCQGSHDKVSRFYPNPSGISDTGTLLYYWNEVINGRWMSFITPDCHNYSMQFYRNNFQFKEKFNNLKLFYHATSGADNRHLYWDDYLKAYEESK